MFKGIHTWKPYVNLYLHKMSNHEDIERYKKHIKGF